jgi:hypothetical protein
VKTNKVIRKVLLIGGGKEFCMKYGDFVSDLFRIAGQKIPKKSDFSSVPYLTDCFNTITSQEILKYQSHHYIDFLKEMRYQKKKTTN